MRLFRSNKSQGSLHNISVGRSPLHSPIESPLSSPAFPPPQSAAYGPGAGAAQFDESVDPPDAQQRYHSSDDQQSLLDQRTQAQHSSSRGYQGAPVVNIIPEQLDENQQIRLNTAVSVEQEERSQKRSTKRSLFGLHSSKDSNSHAHSIFGSSHSTTNKGPGPQSQEGPVPHSAPTQHPGEEYSTDTYGGSESTNAYIPPPSHPDVDEQYYRQDSHFDLPQSQPDSHYPTPYPGEGPHQDLQHTSHRPYPPPLSDTSSPYLAYNPQIDRPSLDIHDPSQTIRPPSQQSLGPPSPIVSLPKSTEPRPSTAQGRPSNQPSQSSHLQPQGMARGDVPNASMRQLGAPHQQGGEQNHSQYGGPQGSRQLQHPEHGRSTPPNKNREDFNSHDYATLLQKHEELQTKYSKVKKYYFEKDAQVTALQNTVANQRLSMSKTTLDDHEYTTRFNRLDGAINNLSFNIRKDWKGIPPWLAAMVNKDAHAVGTKEMLAVGRACITRWVVDEILDRYFHPRLEPGLSSQLKIIEKNIRRAGQSQAMGEEQREDLIVKLTSWRLTTLEGLADSMATEKGNEYKQQLTTNLMEKLTASLQMNLNEPPPPGLESGVGMIIELAIGLASSLPLESRDVYVEYYMPGSFINETYMKMESSVPPLTNPGMNVEFPPGPEPQADQASTHSGDSNELTEVEGDGSGLPPRADSLQGQGGNGGSGKQSLIKEESRKKSRFGGLVGSSSSKKSSTSESSSGNGGLVPGSNMRMGSTSSNVSGGGLKDRESMEKADRDRRIRFAAFVGVEVRGKGKEGGNVLVKAPCYGF